MKKLHILVVEYESAVRELAKEIFASAGHTVRTASTGEQAIGLLQLYEPFDLVLTDYRMGQGMTGIELAKAIQSISSAPVNPVIWLWSGAPEQEFGQLKHLGITRFITKPLGPNGLLGPLAEDFGQTQVAAEA